MEGKRFSGKRLRRMRERAKMAQFEMARQMSVEIDVISAWERGSLLPGPNAINKLTAILRCEEADLYE
ncbi:helix-turn-helix domain-containing protein [Eubacteriales bacterium OttesenSCG-928-A19]|nr:helix-turn-helix domain-containing protein [Eubacteriales bacterium OttesenSCG-928-A19]